MSGVCGSCSMRSSSAWATTATATAAATGSGAAGRHACGGPEQVLVHDWCQQHPVHSIGDLAFGSGGALYASAS